jgi:chemotaxis protein MotB
MNAPLLREFGERGRSPVATEIVVGAVGGSPHVRRRRRRRGQRDADRVVHNHKTERWMVSYADFMTLLFAFFVVMYAMSSVNEGRYRVLSGALSTAFVAGDSVKAGAASGTAPSPATAPPTAGAQSEPKVASTAPPTPPPPTPPPTPATEPPPAAAAAPEEPIDPVERAEMVKNQARVAQMTQLATRMDEQLKALVRDGQVHVTRGARGVAIEINAEVLFDPAKADLKSASFPALRSLALALSSFREPLQIEGHTDDLPISTREFKSNWELSAARAASVGRFLIGEGIAPGRIGIAGYADNRPLVANSTRENRSHNRRVTLLVLSADDSRPQEGGAPQSAPGDAEPLQH